MTRSKTDNFDGLKKNVSVFLLSADATEETILLGQN